MKTIHGNVYTKRAVIKVIKLIQTHLGYLINHSGIMRIALQTIRYPSPFCAPVLHHPRVKVLRATKGWRLLPLGKISPLFTISPNYPSFVPILCDKRAHYSRVPLAGSRYADKQAGASIQALNCSNIIWNKDLSLHLPMFFIQFE